MTRLTKIEKETIILFNEGESTASIYTYNAGLKKRLAAFSKNRQVPAVHPLATAVQRGTQAESQSARPEKWFQRQDKVMQR